MNKRFWFYSGILVVLILSVMVTTGQETSWDLAQTAEVTLRLIGETRFSIDYPDEWFITQERRAVVFTEKEGDLAPALEGPYTATGYALYIGIDSYSTVDASRDATTAQVMEAYAEYYGYVEPLETVETTFLGWPVLQVRTQDAMGNDVVALHGHYHGLGAINFRLIAPDADALDAFLPTFAAMRESIHLDAGFVKLGDYVESFECAGTGNPVVILEPNIQGSVNIWSTAMIEIERSNVTRVCTHTRNLMGQSGQYPMDVFVEELDRLLAEIGDGGPYILVGPWVGGHFARAFAGTHPDAVAGLVLVDSFHPASFDRQRQIIQEFGDADDVAAFDERAANDLAIWILDWEASKAQIEAVDNLGNMPLVVLAPRNWGLANPPDFTREMTDLWQAAWLDMQADLATLSSDGELIILEDARHSGMATRPEITEVILHMVEDWRNAN